MSRTPNYKGDVIDRIKTKYQDIIPEEREQGKKADLKKMTLGF